MPLKSLTPRELEYPGDQHGSICRDSWITIAINNSSDLKLECQHTKFKVLFKITCKHMYKVQISNIISYNI